MLVLSRKESEKIYIGEGDSQIVITAVRIKGTTVRIGVTAPKELNIRRSELDEEVDGTSTQTRK